MCVHSQGDTVLLPPNLCDMKTPFGDRAQGFLHSLSLFSVNPESPGRQSQGLEGIQATQLGILSEEGPSGCFPQLGCSAVCAGEGTAAYC